MDAYVGEIRQFAGNYAPQGWAFCNGQLLSISGNEMLFTVIGTKYGGDGQTTFALPDFRGRLVIHQGTSPMSGTTYTMGQKAGTETVTLNQQQIPVHTHEVAASSIAEGTIPNPSNAVWAQGQFNQYSDAEPNDAMKVDTVSPSGGGQPHENMMPYITVSYIIALTGIYPTRS